MFSPEADQSPSFEFAERLGHLFLRGARKVRHLLPVDVDSHASSVFVVSIDAADAKKRICDPRIHAPMGQRDEPQAVFPGLLYDQAVQPVPQRGACIHPRLEMPMLYDADVRVLYGNGGMAMGLLRPDFVMPQRVSFSAEPHDDVAAGRIRHLRFHLSRLDQIDPMPSLTLSEQDLASREENLFLSHDGFGIRNRRLAEPQQAIGDGAGSAVLPGRMHSVVLVVGPDEASPRIDTGTPLTLRP